MTYEFIRLLGAAAVACAMLSEAFAPKESRCAGRPRQHRRRTSSATARIPPPPVISRNPTTGATITNNEFRSFFEGILRAGQLEASCDECAMVTEGTPVTVNPLNGLKELDPTFPQFTTNSNGLGARHNADQCFACHGHPTLGGSGGFLVPNPAGGRRCMRREPENPQFDLIPHRFGKQNAVPSFQEQYGPIREVRFIYQVDRNGNIRARCNGKPIPDGGVHQLWIVKGIQGDPTIPNCALTQPDFEKQLRQNNWRSGFPADDGTGADRIRSRIARFWRGRRRPHTRAALGIAGQPNRSGNDGTITRFGWKAQNKSITMFAGEAYNVEMGITNELFPQPRRRIRCNGPDKPEPNDVTRMDTERRVTRLQQSAAHYGRLDAVPALMRFTDGPQPDPNPSRAQSGPHNLQHIGCALCHTPTMQTAPGADSEVLQIRPVNLFSDLLVHDMGTGLADGITQGAAGPREFRTTPLWGVGQRIFFLHDGRTSDLLEAIRAHRSCGSEANAVIGRFESLSVTDKQAILDFLRAL